MSIKSTIELTREEAEDKVLKLLPECPLHGFCLPHYEDQIKKLLKTIMQKVANY